jgi:hypothetical protein
MFGYSEEEYTVIDSITHNINGTTHNYELRQSNKIDDYKKSGFYNSLLKNKEKNADKINQYIANCEEQCKPYISVFGTNSENKPIYDILFFYNDVNESLLESNWEDIKLTHTKELKDFNHSYRIENHHIGYGNDGSITMY